MSDKYKLIVIKSEKLENTNYVNLPEKILDDLIKKNIKSPYYFRIRSASNIKTWVGVREFTSVESTIEISQSLIDFLCLDNSGEIEIKLENFIPKGKKVKLEPQSKNFFDIPECEGCLENILSNNFCSLHKNQELIIKVLEEDYKIKVLDVDVDWNRINLDKENSSDILSENVIEIKNIDLDVEINNKFLTKKEDQNVKENNDIKENNDKLKNIKEKDKDFKYDRKLVNNIKTDENSKKLSKEELRKARLKFFENKFKSKKRKKNIII